MGKKKKSLPTGLIIGIGLALIVFLATFSLLSGKEEITHNYYVAKKFIAPETKITEENFNDLFKTVTIPQEVVIKNGIPTEGLTVTEVNINNTDKKKKDEEPVGQAVDSKEFLIGKTFYYPVFENDMEILNKLDSQIPDSLKNISKDIPNDRRLIPLTMNILNSFGGSIKPGDRIDLTFMFEEEGDPNVEGDNGRTKAITALQALKVHSLIYDSGVKAAAEAGDTSVMPNGVAVLMTPEQVELFTLLGSGSYILTMNSSSPEYYPTEGLSIDQLLNTNVKEYFFYRDSTSQNTDNNSNNDNQDVSNNDNQNTNDPNKVNVRVIISGDTVYYAVEGTPEYDLHEFVASESEMGAYTLQNAIDQNWVLYNPNIHGTISQ